ncbi:riboflavin synthase subunit beta [Mesonia sp. K7]|uniref:riboflavin synthase subunit beta n=1 Tax=Mesonia sp. K7 TaxID=2218606 RepID=UPI000DA7C7A5|nr:riboflavin synthase subunit beta [Mesonia sp. K7]PZD78289.1 riboflavin synthase subunit beta [Mesonia sp. K7]
MGFLSRKGNKKFSYKPRYYNHDSEKSPFAVESKYDKYRSTIGKTGGLFTRFKRAWDELREESLEEDKKSKHIIILLVVLFILIFLFIIDFDLSIFYSK